MGGFTTIGEGGVPKGEVVSHGTGAGATNASISASVSITTTSTDTIVFGGGGVKTIAVTETTTFKLYFDNVLKASTSGSGTFNRAALSSYEDNVPPGTHSVSFSVSGSNVADGCIFATCVIGAVEVA